MHRKNLWKRLAVGLMAAAVLVSSTPQLTQMTVYAADGESEEETASYTYTATAYYGQTLSDVTEVTPKAGGDAVTIGGSGTDLDGYAWKLSDTELVKSDTYELAKQDAASIYVEITLGFDTSITADSAGVALGTTNAEREGTEWWKGSVTLSVNDGYTICSSDDACDEDGNFTLTNFTSSVTITDSQGAYSYYLREKSSGKVSAELTYDSLKVDGTKPALGEIMYQIGDGEAQTLSKNVVANKTITVTVPITEETSGVDKWAVYINGDDDGTDASLVYTGEGENQKLEGISLKLSKSVAAEAIKIFVSDIAGNKTTKTIEQSFLIDMSAPTVELSIDGTSDANGYYEDTATVKATVSLGDGETTDSDSGLDAVTYSLDSGAATNASVSDYGSDIAIGSEVTTAGEHTITVTATDKAGNEATDTETFKVKATNVTVSLAKANEGKITYTGSEIEASAVLNTTVTGVDESEVVYHYKASSASKGDSYTDGLPTNAGSYVVYASVKKTAYHDRAESGEVGITIAKAAAPTVTTEDTVYVSTEGVTGAEYDFSDLLPDDGGYVLSSSCTVADSSSILTDAATTLTSGKYTYTIAEKANLTQDASATVTVTATSDNYEDITYTLTITQTTKTIIESNSELTAPTVEAITYDPEKTLKDVEISATSVTINAATVNGSWAWVDESIIPICSNSGYQAVFTPADESNVINGTKTATVTVTVNKATAPANAPSALTDIDASLGTVANVTGLPDGWTWAESSKSTALVAGSTITATAKYTADDANCYTTTTAEVSITCKEGTGSSSDSGTSGGSSSSSGGSSSSSGGSSGGSSSSSGSTSGGSTTTDTNTNTNTNTNTDNTAETTTTQTIEGLADGETASLTVTKDASGAVTKATAILAETVASAKEAKKTTIDGAAVAKLVAAAGTNDVAITVYVNDTTGTTLRTVKVNAADLTAGAKVIIVKYDAGSGEYVLVNAKTYTVAADGSVTVNTSKSGEYKVISSADGKKLVKAIKKTIAAKKAKKTLKVGKKTKMALKGTLNMENVKKITYSSSKKSVATVSKTGKITAKKAGTAVIKAKVTLKNGATKTVKMTVKVKKK